MIRFLGIACVFLLSSTLNCFATRAIAGDGSARPNILIVMTDDQGLGELPYTGNPVLKTPNLDRFARESVRLTDFHVCPVCTPTRAQLLTGLAAVRNGATYVGSTARPGIPMMPAIFATAGYKTGIFGKWHLGDSQPNLPSDKEFHESMYHLGWGMNELIDDYYFQNGKQKKFQGHVTDLWFDQAMLWMKARKEAGEPFLCYLPTNAPHAPHIEESKYVERFSDHPAAEFFGMIAHIDNRFGDLQKFLDENGLRDNTIVIFMTDNGGTSGVSTYNAGLRDGKFTLYEGGHRVPCWIRWPNGNLGQPRDIDVPTQNTDILPTLMELCGIEGSDAARGAGSQPAIPLGETRPDAKPAPRTADSSPMPADAQRFFSGTSLAGILRGTQPKLDDRMFPNGRMFVVQFGVNVAKYQSCVIWNQWRLVHGNELYDVATDRVQAVNVGAKNPDVMKAMRDYYEAWWSAAEPFVRELGPLRAAARPLPLRAQAGVQKPAPEVAQNAPLETPPDPKDIAKVEALGGNVMRDDSQPGSPVVFVNLSGTAVSDADLKLIGRLKDLTYLGLIGTKITDAGLKELVELQKLEELRVGNTSISDVGLKEIAKLKNLKMVGLIGTNVTDAGLKEFSEALPNMRHNLMANPGGGGRGMRPLRGTGGGNLEGGHAPDPNFDVSVPKPAYTDTHPSVLFDETHQNFHTASGRYKVFANLMTNDGYQIVPNTEQITPERLAEHKILVIANAMAAGGTSKSAFTEAECDSIEKWVSAGGSVLLITDHEPFGSASEELGKRFGVEMSLSVAIDPANESTRGLLFSREKNQIGDHQIMTGRDKSERVDRVLTFTGQSLKGPETSVALLKFSETARHTGNGINGSAAGRNQGLALKHGEGRVVVMGEAAQMSAQVIGNPPEPMGMNVPGCDNRQMALNLMHWLSGLTDAANLSTPTKSVE